MGEKRLPLRDVPLILHELLRIKMPFDFIIFYTCVNVEKIRMFRKKYGNYFFYLHSIIFGEFSSLMFRIDTKIEIHEC